jgi:serine/threonine-protein kinase
MQLKRGHRLGTFEILEPIGAGGMGEVYRARDTRLGRDVAIKVLPPETSGSPERHARFEREARSVAALNHENIVTIHAIDDADGIPFLAMELVEGQTLDKLIPQGGMSTDRLLEIAIPVAAALAAAHGKGIVHRDLKPANIMVTHEGKVKVLDFGLAKLAGADDDAPTGPVGADDPTATAMVTRDGVIVGTVPYMSPEQLAGRPVGTASDLFSFGTLLYEMATGERPFKGRSSTELISSILTGTPEPVGELKPSLPPPMGDQIGQCLAKEPGDRPSSAEQVRRDLEALRTVQSDPAIAAPAATQAKSPARRIGIATAVVVVAILAAVIGWRTLAPKQAAVPAEMLRLAAIPFSDDGTESAAYVGSGLVDEIARRLAGLRALAVVPANNTAVYRDSTQEPIEIGRELDVDYIVAGAVTSTDDQISVEPRLIRVSDDETVWTESYDVSADNVLGLQSDIASRVVRALGVTFSEKEQARLQMRSTDNPVAYEAYLRGVEAQPHSHSSEAEYRAALRLFEQAVKLDPDFVLALLGLAHNHLQIYWLGYDRTEARMNMANDALDRAEQLAPGLADVHLARGYMYYHGSLDFDGALAELSLAAQDIPNDAELIRTIGYIWRRQGLFEQALENLERARELTPYEPYQNVELAYSRLFLDDYDEIFNEIDTLRAHNPDYDWSYMLAAFAYWHRGLEGDLDRARQELAKHPDPRDDYPAWFVIGQHWYDRDFEMAQARIANLAVPYLKLQAHIAPRDFLAGMTYLMQGDPESARPRLERALVQLEGLLEELPGDHHLFAALGLTHAALGNKDEALRLGELAVELYPTEQDALMGPDRLWDLVKINVMVGNHDEALDQLAYLLSLRTHYSAAMLNLDPALDPLRDHPRYTSLMGL